MKNSIYIPYFTCMLLLISSTSCKKFLDEKPRSNLAVPNSLKDFQALLDLSSIMNDLDAASGEASVTDTYLTTANFLARTETLRRLYTWQNAEVYEPLNNEWANLYRVVYRTNTVLEGINEIATNNVNFGEWSSVKGQAHFYRAKMFLLGLSIWAKAYRKTSAATDLGVPLRLNVNFNEISVRSTVEVGYQQVVNDLKHAANLLPLAQVHVMRPSKPAAYAMLSRVHLYMGNFREASLYADSCIMLKPDLIDYNTLDPNANYPIAAYNKEVIHTSMMQLLTVINPSTARVDPQLYSSYSDDDLRKKVFFLQNPDGSFRFKGSYQGSANLFSGIASDEMYLTRAECLARLGEDEAALRDLNLLLMHRFKAGTFIPHTVANTENLLKLILDERRKQLLLRNLRWMDVKRLNILGAGISFQRDLNGITYYLQANSPRFAMPIPETVVALSGISQNKYE